MNITEILVPPQALAWLPWAVQYFFYIGSAYAAAILFVISFICRSHTSHQWRSALVLVMAISAVIGPIALTADLHQPGRSLHFFLHFTPWSWMSIGSLLLPTFSGLAVITAWLYLRDDIAQLKQSSNIWIQRLSLLTLGQWKTSNKLMLSTASLTGLSGLTIALYTGLEIAVLASRPLWHQPASPLLWFVTAFIGAIGLSMVIVALMKSQSVKKHERLSLTDRKIIRHTLILMSTLAMVFLPIWASNHVHNNLFDIYEWQLRFATLFIGFIACIIVGIWVTRSTLKRPQLLLFSLVTLLSCWYLRWVTMMEVQTLPNYDAGPYPYSLPIGSNGLLGILGMLGLWLAIATVVTELLNFKQSTHTRKNHANSHEASSNG